jgi:hypothetical protein
MEKGFEKVFECDKGIRKCFMCIGRDKCNYYEIMEVTNSVSINENAKYDPENKTLMIKHDQEIEECDKIQQNWINNNMKK